MRRTSWIITGVVAGVSLITLGVLAYCGTKRSDAICPLCGQTRVTRQFQIPGTAVTLFTRVSPGQSLVGGILEQNQVIEAHAHTWKTVSIVGNGTELTPGDGAAAGKLFNSQQLADYMQAIVGFQSHQAIVKYLATLQTESATDPAAVGRTPTALIDKPFMDPVRKRVDLSDMKKADDPQQGH